MEEKKKRVRPTWALVKSLRDEIAGHLDDKSRLVSDCDGWREKYRDLLTEVKELRVAKSTLERSVDTLKERNDALASDLASADAAKKRLLDEVERLKSRGFFGRMFNR